MIQHRSGFISKSFVFINFNHNQQSHKMKFWAIFLIVFALFALTHADFYDEEEANSAEVKAFVKKVQSGKITFDDSDESD